MRGNLHICIAPAYRMASRWHFEDHPYCGPTLLDKRGEPTSALLDSDTHPFWGHYQRWCDQGKRVDDKGNALVDWVRKVTP